MKWIQTGCHLHRLYLVHGLTGSIERTSQIERWTTIGVVVFDDEILHLLSVHKRSGEGVFLGLYIVIILESIGSKELFHLLMWTWGNLVYHRPREGNLLLILQVAEECLWYQTVLHPALSVCKHTCLHLVAIVRAVVHRLHGEWQFTCLETLIEQDRNLTHSEHGLHATCKICVIEAVALLGDGEGYHLQCRIAEDVYEALPVGKLVVSLQGFCDTGNNLLLDIAITLQRHEQGEVVVWCVCLVNDLEVEGLCNNHTTVILSCV